MRFKNMRSAILAGLLCAANAHYVSATPHDGHAPIAVKPAEVYKPSAIPDRVVLTWKSDPRTTQSVTW